MTITVKLHASLNRYDPLNKEGILKVDNMNGKKLSDLIQYLSLNLLDIGFCTVNKTIIPVYNFDNSNLVLRDKDYVEIFTAMKGG